MAWLRWCRNPPLAAQYCTLQPRVLAPMRSAATLAAHRRQPCRENRNFEFEIDHDRSQLTVTFHTMADILVSSERSSRVRAPHAGPG